MTRAVPADPVLLAGQRMIVTGLRLGFFEEGRFRRARPWQGEDYDSVVLGVSREERSRDAGVGARTGGQPR
jgi:hypothetical protein